MEKRGGCLIYKIIFTALASISLFFFTSPLKLPRTSSQARFTIPLSITSVGLRRQIEIHHRVDALNEI